MTFDLSIPCFTIQFLIDRSRLNDVTQPNADVCSVCVLKNKNPWWDAREARFSAMCVGGFLIGLGTGLFATLGIVYIEENGDQDTCPLYYGEYHVCKSLDYGRVFESRTFVTLQGILMSMTGLGKFLGSCFVWWFLGYTEDLTGKNTFTDSISMIYSIIITNSHFV